MTQNNDWAQTITELMQTIEVRKNATPDTSYTASLLQGAPDALLKKLIEEAGETALAATSGDPNRLCEELADLWFHCLVAMSRYNVSLSDIAEVLAKRRGVSGLSEKAARNK